MDFQGRRDDMFLLVSLNIFGSVMIQELRNHMKTNHYLFYSFFLAHIYFDASHVKWVQRESRMVGFQGITTGNHGIIS